MKSLAAKFRRMLNDDKRAKNSAKVGQFYYFGVRRVPILRNVDETFLPRDDKSRGFKWRELFREIYLSRDYFKDNNYYLFKKRV